MVKEEALIEFLKGLRIAINNSLAYSRQHPYFLKSAQEFQEKIESLFDFLDPIKVNVMPKSLLLDGKDCQKLAFVPELANILHQRKIKSVEFRSGLTAGELADFLSVLSRQPKEIIKNGGLARLLIEAGIRHIRAEDLDYSGLLGSQGQEAKDVWMYLFKDTIESQNARKINELAANFSKGINNLNVKKVIEDDKLREDLRNFLRYLKETKNENFAKCSQELSSLIISSGDQFSADNIGRLKEVFQDLDNNDFSDILLSRLSDEKDLNPLSLELFSRLAGEDRVDKIASGLEGRVSVKAGLKNKTVLLKKIKDLLSDPDNTTVSPVYRRALSALLKNISSAEILSFEREQLRSNYHMIILNLLAQEDNTSGLDLLLSRLSKEWENITEEKDYRFLKYLLDTLKQKKERLSPDSLETIEKQITLIVENNIWVENPSLDLACLADSLEKSYSAASFYLEKIFQEKKLSPPGLKLFLRLFPSQLNIFYEHLKQELSDLEFLSQIIEALALIDLPVAAAVLKAIFSLGNELVKIETLKAMRSAKEFDPDFLFSLLKGKSRILKKEALAVLLRDSVTQQRAIDILLGIKSPWGRRNKLILENIIIIEELNVNVVSSYMLSFSQKKFFWNRQLRNAALKVLEKWK